MSDQPEDPAAPVPGNPGDEARADGGAAAGGTAADSTAADSTTAGGTAAGRTVPDGEQRGGLRPKRNRRAVADGEDGAVIRM